MSIEKNIDHESRGCGYGRAGLAMSLAGIGGLGAMVGSYAMAELGLISRETGATASCCSIPAFLTISILLILVATNRPGKSS